MKTGLEIRDWGLETDCIAPAFLSNPESLIYG